MRVGLHVELAPEENDIAIGVLVRSDTSEQHGSSFREKKATCSISFFCQDAFFQDIYVKLCTKKNIAT
eukprot:m.148488 g.148488  ORF g.148488 m.148488 type:complete len:68 (+) comp38498_c1_seq26:1183-1386(+)